MASSNDALSITFSEDDLRPSRVGRRSQQKGLPEKIERRDKIPRTPPHRGTSIPRQQSLDERRIPSSRSERRNSVRKIRSADESERRLREDLERKMRVLEDREKEDKARLERMQKEEEKLKRLREELEKEDAMRHQQLLEERSGSGLHSPEDLPTPPEALQAKRSIVQPSVPSPPAIQRRSSHNSRYNRFSNFKYYNWSSDEEDRKRSPSREDLHQHDHSDGSGCELCTLGKKYEDAQKGKKKHRGYVDDNCRIVDEFAKRQL